MHTNLKFFCPACANIPIEKIRQQPNRTKVPKGIEVSNEFVFICFVTLFESI